MGSAERGQGRAATAAAGQLARCSGGTGLSGDAESHRFAVGSTSEAKLACPSDVRVGSGCDALVVSDSMVLGLGPAQAPACGSVLEDTDWQKLGEPSGDGAIEGGNSSSQPRGETTYPRAAGNWYPAAKEKEAAAQSEAADQRDPHWDEPSSLASSNVDGREDRGRANVSLRRISRGDGNRKDESWVRCGALDSPESDLRAQQRHGACHVRGGTGLSRPRTLVHLEVGGGAKEGFDPPPQGRT